jgi:hypothetical protein
MLFDKKLSGRQTPVYSSYRPSFGFNTAIHYSVEIRLIDKKKLLAGLSSMANINLLTIGTGVIEKVEMI